MVHNLQTAFRKQKDFFLHVIPVNKHLLRSYWVLLHTLKKVKMLVIQSYPTLCNTMDYIAYQAPLLMEFCRQE